MNIKFVSQGCSAVCRLIYLETYEKKTTVGQVSKYNLKLLLKLELEGWKGRWVVVLVDWLVGWPKGICSVIHSQNAAVVEKCMMTVGLVLWDILFNIKIPLGTNLYFGAAECPKHCLPWCGSNKIEADHGENDRS